MIRRPEKVSLEQQVIVISFKVLQPEMNTVEQCFSGLDRMENPREISFVIARSCCGVSSGCVARIKEEGSIRDAGLPYGSPIIGPSLLSQ